MSAPESLDQARRDGWDEDEEYPFENPYDYFGEPEAVVEDEPIEVVSERVRDRYRRAA
jgi:hypothetical protein